MVRFPLFALPFRAMTPTSQERMRRQQKNWGRPSGGTDYFVDAVSRRKWQGLKHARMGINANSKGKGPHDKLESHLYKTRRKKIVT